MNLANTSRPNTAAQGPRWALLKGRGFWELIFDGQPAVFKHEQGAYYTAYLLLHPPAEPLHGLALALRTEAMFQPPKAATELEAFPGGQRVAPDAGALFLERSLGLEEALAGLGIAPQTTPTGSPARRRGRITAGQGRGRPGTG